MFLRNSWYIAAERSEVQEEVLARTLLNEKLAIFRTQSGAPAVFENRCPHRLVPLSIGKVVGETLQCGYHGAAFAPDGRCVRIPGQDKVPSVVRVRSYPVIEKYGYIWVWMGDPALSSDQSSIPAGYWRSGSDAWYGGYGRFLSLKADYRLLNDNVIDITHAEFVHPDSLGGEESQLFRKAKRSDEARDGAVTYSIRDRSIQFRMVATNLPEGSAPLFRQMVADRKGLSAYTKHIDIRVDVEWSSPCYTAFLLSARATDEPEAPACCIYNLHAAIPETEASTHYFYRSLRNFGSAADAERVQKMADYIFAQDKPVLEAQQSVVGRSDIFELKTVSFAGDRLPIEARRILKGMIDGQQMASPGRDPAQEIPLRPRSVVKDSQSTSI